MLILGIQKKRDSAKSPSLCHTALFFFSSISEKLSSKEVEKLDELCKSQVDENGRFKYKDFMQLILLR